jgi:hypothetical protein
MIMTSRLEAAAERILCTLSQTLDAMPPHRLASIPLPPLRKGYHKALLSRDDQVEVCAARWLAGGQSKLHGHGGSAALYHVVSGAVEEERYVPNGDAYRYESEVIPAGGCSYLPPGSFHRVRALDEAVTVHSYSPPPTEATASVPPDTLRLLKRAKRLASTRRAVQCRRSMAGYSCQRPDRASVGLERRQEIATDPAAEADLGRARAA